MHNKIVELRRQTAGQFMQSRYDKKVDFKVRVDTKERVVKGYLAVFGVRDSYGTVAVKGCFAKSIKERGPLSSAKDKIIFIAFHDPTEPIGQFTTLKEDSYGLYFEALIDDTPGMPKRCLDQINSGTLNQYSYGFDYVYDQLEYHEDSDSILMREVILYEGTVLALFASNPETYTVRTRAEKLLEMEQINLEMEEAMTALPKKRQLRIKQLVTRYNSLIRTKPLNKKALRSGKPKNKTVKVGEYNLKF